MWYSQPMLDLHAPWSISKSDLAAKCGRAFRYKYIDRLPRKTGEAAVIGVTAHRAQELILQHAPPRDAVDTALTEATDLTSKETTAVWKLLPAMQSFYERIQAFKQKHGVTEEYFEQKWAVDRKLRAVPYDSAEAFFRGIVDYGMRVGDRLLIVDHKSGRRHPVSKYALQLDSYAVLGLASFPELRGVQAALHYMQGSHVDWHTVRPSTEIRKTLNTHLLYVLGQRANKLTDYPVQVNKLCKWCDFLERCPEGQQFVEEAALASKARAKAAAERRKAEAAELAQLQADNPDYDEDPDFLDCL